MRERFRGHTGRNASGVLVLCAALCSLWLRGFAPAEARADDEKPDGPPVKEMTAGGDEHMRFFLIGLNAKAAPAGGYRLLLVLPGGDGSEEFRPFVTNVAARALPDGYLVAQLVAPKWREGNDRIVWPTEKVPDDKMKFPTEEFIDAVVGEVRKGHEVDAKHVYALGWSSGGPPVYAAAMRPETPLTGAFVAMSVFKPADLPPAEKLDGRAFYVLHGNRDFIPMRFPELARDMLAKAGAETKLSVYEGKHGWQGDVFGTIRAGVEWLEERADAR